MRLYKYYPANENSFKSLAMRGIWCHHASQMNDPFECLALNEYEFSSSELNNFRNIVSNSKTSFAKWAALSDENLQKKISLKRKNSINAYAFGALSEVNNDILMWSHYAKCHTGFVLEFEFKNIQNDHHFQKVDYLTSLNNIDINQYANFLIGNDNSLKESMQDISVKSLDWKHEKEWRIWRKNPCYYTYKPEQLKAVYLGINISDDTERTIIELTNYLPKDSLICKMEFHPDPISLKY